MKILITGVSGYIGKSLYNVLKNKHDVYAPTRTHLDLTDSIAVFKFFEIRESFDIVIHCAVSGGHKSKEDGWNVMDENLLMYYNLLSNKNNYKRLIHFGSGAETYMPKEPYGYSKKVIAKSILNQDNFYNLKLFGVFDENELDTRFIKANIKKYINKEPIQIHEVKFMDFFYMQDLIKVVEYYIAEENLPKEFDCVYSKNVYTLFGLGHLINKLDNYKVDIINEGENGENYISKYRTELPIEFIGLDQGIKNTYKALK
jgi:GDP-L-fucose synthase